MFLIMSYLPIALGIIGTISLILYFALYKTKHSIRNIFLVISCIGIGICALIFCALFMAGMLGLGPIPN